MIKAVKEQTATSEPGFEAYHGRRVLVVEDAVVNQEVAKAMLKWFGCEVAIANNGLVALEACAEAERLAELLRDTGPGVHVFGGETTVTLPDKPGIGGRNQQLALAVARQLHADLPVVLLSAGSDGRDGNSEAAGAIVDGQTFTITDLALPPGSQTVTFEFDDGLIPPFPGNQPVPFQLIDKRFDLLPGLVALIPEGREHLLA